MKINASSVSMNSEHLAGESTEINHVSIITRGSGALEKISAFAEQHSGSAVAGIIEYSDVEKQEAQQRKEENQNNLRRMLEQMNENRMQPPLILSDDADMQITLLRKLLAALNGKGRIDPLELPQMKKDGILDLRSSNFKNLEMALSARSVSGASFSLSIGGKGSAQASPAVGTTVSGTTWQKITATSGYHNESEFTSFSSTGLALTEDGRKISFGVEFSMARNFSQKFESITAENVIMTDPLIINIDSKYAGLTDVKFKFDLDNDGVKDDISFAAEGSGFLALDKDGNGMIDNGSELFGTKSGDGFKDLAAYDEDGNSWIDENDAVYSKLRVWTKDSEGNDKLLDLKEANVGAIYLGSASTEFSIKNDSNALQGAVRKTGIYLKETGEVGTLQHVDLAM